MPRVDFHHQRVDTPQSEGQCVCNVEQSCKHLLRTGKRIGCQLRELAQPLAGVPQTLQFGPEDDITAHLTWTVETNGYRAYGLASLRG